MHHPRFMDMLGPRKAALPKRTPQPGGIYRNENARVVLTECALEDTIPTDDRSDMAHSYRIGDMLQPARSVPDHLKRPRRYHASQMQAIRYDERGEPVIGTTHERVFDLTAMRSRRLAAAGIPGFGGGGGMLRERDVRETLHISNPYTHGRFR